MRRATRIETGTLRVGFGVGAALELTAPIVEEFGRRYPGIELDLREYPLSDPSAGLVDGWADVAIVRPPMVDDGLEFSELFVEPRCIGVSANHRLAQRSVVSVGEVLDEPIAMGRSTDGVYRRFWSLEDYRAGKPVTRVRSTNTHTEELEIVAAGLAVTVTAAAAARYTPHSGVRVIPIDDITGTAVALGWRVAERGVLVDHFLQVAAEVRDRETELVARIEQPFV
ncbi:LysR family substrate-binding domain-containing protein [Kribbella sp. NBC_01505]